MKKILFLLLCIFLFNNTYSQQWEKIKTGSEFTIALKSDGSLWGWGFNASGQLGMPATNQIYSSLIKISEDMDWKEIATGGFHSLAIKNNGTLWGAGLNGNGQLGMDEKIQYEEFVQIGNDTDWVYIEAGFVSSYAIKRDGSLWAWGYNANAQLGLGHLQDVAQPTRVGSDNDWERLSCGGLIVLGLKKDKSLWQWGFYFTLDSSGYVFDNILSPSCIDSNDKWLMISAGMEHAFALKEDGTLWAYGDNVNFALGDTSIVVANEFTQITQNKDWKHVEAGSVYTFALNNQGELFAWGNNMLGQLGIVDENDYVVIPTKVSNETEWLSISAAKGCVSDIYIFGMHSVAIKNDDKNNLICVTGANYVGQLGLGSTDQEKNTPFVCNALNVENVLLDESTDISLYPNPATTQLTLDNKDALIKEAHIYDITGRKVSRHSINANQSTLDISTLKSGLYIVKIHTEQGVLNRKVQVVR